MNKIIQFMKINKLATSGLTIAVILFTLMAAASFVNKKSPESIAFDQCMESYEGVDASSSFEDRSQAIGGISSCYQQFRSACEASGNCN